MYEALTTGAVYQLLVPPEVIKEVKLMDELLQIVPEALDKVVVDGEVP